MFQFAYQLSLLLPLTILLWIFTKSIYLAFFSPLARIPGPWYARFTILPYHYKSVLCQKQAQFIHALHQKYGPIIRVGPSYVAVASTDGHKAIHRIGSGFLKSGDFYHFLGPSAGGDPPYGLFQETDPAKHAVRRKLLARGFSANSIRRDWEEMVTQKVQFALDGLAREAKGSGDGSVNMRKWWMLFASDVVSHMMFGKSFDGLKTGKHDPFFDSMRALSEASVLASLLPKWLFAIMLQIPIPSWRRFFDHIKVAAAKGEVAVQNSRSETSRSSRNVFASVLAQAEKDSDEEGRLTDAEINFEASAFMIAGTDTTSNTLTYAIWAVLRQKQLQRELESEVSGLAEPLTDAKLETLPLLNAVIRETLRLYSAAPGPEPRVVPSAGHEFMGYHIPGGTVITTQPWTLHRNIDAFEDPGVFDHTRWLPGGPAIESPTAKAAYHPFGSGSHVCIGKHLAEMELRHAIAMFFRSFPGATLSPETTADSMEIMNYVMIAPKSGVCRVVLPRAGGK